MGNKMSILTVFQSVFFMQALAGDKPVEQIKYVDLSLDFAKNGIASILVQTSRIQDIFSQVGWKVYNSGETIGKYHRQVLEKYFNFTWKPADATPENTTFLHQSNSSAIYVTYTGATADGSVRLDVLKEDFRKEMQEYTEAVFGDKKMLGVLIRGTDYILSGLFGKQVHASCEQMFPMIHEWLEKYHYDGIFLATEDQDILNKTLAEFGPKVRIVSQERFRITDSNQAEQKRTAAFFVNVTVLLSCISMPVKFFIYAGILFVSRDPSGLLTRTADAVYSHRGGNLIEKSVLFECVRLKVFFKDSLRNRFCSLVDSILSWAVSISWGR